MNSNNSKGLGGQLVVELNGLLNLCMKNLGSATAPVMITKLIDLLN